MSYRDEGAALDAKRASLAARLDEARRGPQTDDALDEAHALKREIAALPLPKKVGTSPLGLLPRLRIASPCDESWNEMVGDERVRRCTRCERDVYNLSGFTRVEAEALLSRSGEAPCVRFYRRADGTIMTSDCVQVRIASLRSRCLRRVPVRLRWVGRWWRISRVELHRTRSTCRGARTCRALIRVWKGPL